MRISDKFRSKHFVFSDKYRSKHFAFSDKFHPKHFVHSDKRPYTETFYYTFKEEVRQEDEENRRPRNYEIDFLLSRKGKVCPVEVKSSGYNSHKSLDKFQQKYSDRIPHRYLFYTKDLRKKQDILCLPVYMTGLL